MRFRRKTPLQALADAALAYLRAKQADIAPEAQQAAVRCLAGGGVVTVTLAVGRLGVLVGARAVPDGGESVELFVDVATGNPPGTGLP